MGRQFRLPLPKRGTSFDNSHKINKIIESIFFPSVFASAKKGFPFMSGCRWDIKTNNRAFDYWRVVRKDDSLIKDMIYENLNSQNINYNLEEHHAP